MTITQRPSPNHNARPAGLKLDTIILHDTGSKTLESAASWCQNPASKVSYHYIVDLDGAVVQLVDEARRAWHAGKAALPGERESDVNGRSVGVAMVNDGASPYPAAQVEATAELCVAIMERHELVGMGRIRGHRDVALPHGRKDDPHRLFPWPHFRPLVHERAIERGVDRVVLRRGSVGPAVAHLQTLLRDLGYMTADVPTAAQKFGDATERAVRAFQRDQGLQVDGVVGPRTWVRLDEKAGQRP